MGEKQVEPFAFVSMPFDERYDDVYKFGIHQACTELGIRCERLESVTDLIDLTPCHSERLAQRRGWARSAISTRRSSFSPTSGSISSAGTKRARRW